MRDKITRVQILLLTCMVAGFLLCLPGLAEAYDEVVRSNFRVLATIFAKTLNMTVGTSPIVVEGATDDAYETTLNFTDPTADRTITFPNATGTVQVSGQTFTLANSDTLSSSAAGTFLLTRSASGTVTLTAADDNATAAMTILPGGAAAMTVGGASTTSVTLTTDSTGTAEVVMPTGAVDATEITDITRAVSLPIAAWTPCTGQEIWTTDGTDAAPNLTAVNTGLAITYDATGGSVDTGKICTAFLVPDEYISGGEFVARITQGAATVTQVETWSCDVSLDGAALVGANAANLTNQTAVQSATSTPVVTYVVGKSVAVACSQGNASADDVVNIHGVRWTYTASE